MKLIKSNYETDYHDHPLYRETNKSQRNQARLRVLLEYCQEGRLLEVGCGRGGFLQLAEQTFEVEGIDIAHSAIDAIRPHFGERVRVLNIEQRPLPSHGFHAIAAFNILEHLRQPNRIVEKLAGALLPGGILIGSVPNNYGLVGGLVTRIGNLFDRTHISTFTPETWQRILHHSGFGQVDLFGELNLGRNRCVYQRNRFWPFLSFNLMFVGRKGPAVNLP